MASSSSSSGRIFGPAVVPRRFPSPSTEPKPEAAFTGLEGLEGQAEAWRALGERALVPEVIAEPEVMLPGLRHRANARTIPVLTIRQGDALRLVMPLITPRLPVGGAPPRPWRAVPGTPGILVDRDKPDLWLRLAFDMLAERGPRFGALLLRDIPREGALADAIALASARSGRRLQAQQALAGPEAVGSADPDADLEKLRLRRIQLRRNEGVVLDRVRDPKLLRDALEEFLTLDALWASAEKRPGLIDDVGECSFLRTATRQLAQNQRCRIDVLRIAGKAVAAVIVARGGTTARVFGVAADPAFAHLDLKDAVLFEAWRAQGGRGPLDLSALPARVPSPALVALSGTPDRLDLRVALQETATPQTLAYDVRDRVMRGLRSVTRRATGFKTT